MSLYPAAENVQELLGTDDLESQFIEILLWYDGFNNPILLNLLPHQPEDISIIEQKRDSARREKDYKTSDHLRDVLIGAGVRVRDKTS